MSRWHPSSDQLVEYASGTGSWALNILISTHLHFCHQCRREVSQLESTAAVFFDQQQPVELESQGFSRLLGRLQETKAAERKEVVAPTRFPAVIEKIIGHDIEALTWSNPLKNLRVSQLMKDDKGAVLSLHHMKAGGKVPNHTHRGNEISLVIEGGFSDSIGSYVPGDFIHLSSEHAHSPQADADGDCWLLTLVEAPVKLTGPLGWVVNPFLKA